MRSHLSIHEEAGFLSEDPSHSQAQFMYAEKENIAQILVNTPYLGIQITFIIRSVNLAEVWDQVMECVPRLFFSQISY